MNIEWIPSPNHYNGRTQGIREIIVHWWGDPRGNPQIGGVIAHFQNPASQVSAHYVVGQGRVVQMLREEDAGWHARQANPFTIGIEVDPNADDNTYKLVGQLVRDIRNRRGNLPLKKHSDYVATACPGSISLDRINKEAQGTDMSEVERLKAEIQLILHGPRGADGKDFFDNWKNETYRLGVELGTRNQEIADLKSQKAQLEEALAKCNAPQAPEVPSKPLNGDNPTPDPSDVKTSLFAALLELVKRVLGK